MRRLAFVLTVLAASAAAQQPQPPLEREPLDPRKNQKIERIKHEDEAVRIDELRVGGQMQSITVQPKRSKLPAYEVNPVDGKRTWNVLAF